jgi:hypothetical protein
MVFGEYQNLQINILIIYVAHVHNMHMVSKALAHATSIELLAIVWVIGCTP